MRALLLSVLAISGCAALPDDGALMCNPDPSHACPSGYECAANGYCYRTGHLPDLATAMETDGGVDLGTDGGGTPPDLAPPPHLFAFNAGLSFPANAEPSWIAVADLNGDGAPDVAVPNQSGASVLFNDGTGKYGGPLSYSTGSGGSGIAAADLDGDHYPELIVVNASSNTVSVLTNLRNSTFGSTSANYAVGTSPTDVTVADVNGDGAIDVIVTNTGSNNISVLTNKKDGTGGLNAAANYAITAPQRVATGLMNNDQAIDLIVTSTSGNTVTVMLNNGSGAFTSLPSLAAGPTGSNPNGVAVGDVNRDQFPDVIIANAAAGDIGVLINKADGTGNLNAVVPYGSFPAGTYPTAVALGDLNGDTIPDVALADIAGGISVFVNKGNGTFSVPQARYAGGAAPSSIALANTDGDKKLDILVPNINSNDVTVIRGNGDGTFRSAVFQPTAGRGVVVADFDGDSKLDVATVATLGSDVDVFVGDGAGGLAAAKTYAIGASSTNLVVGDFDGNSKPDVAVTTSGSSIVVMLNSSGTLGAGTSYSVGTTPYAATVADFNGDGAADIATANHDSSDVSVLINSGGNTGTFKTAVTVAAGMQPQAIASGNLNTDGKPDLVVANNADGTVTVFLNKNDGTGAMNAGTPYSVGTASSNPTAVALVDANGDTKLDIVVGFSHGTTLQVLINNGDGTFTSGPGITTFGTFVSSIAVADFNSDHLQDIAVANNGNVSVYLGSAGMPLFATTFFLDGGLSGLVGADLNNDGKPDLVGTGVGCNVSLNLSY